MWKVPVHASEIVGKASLESRVNANLFPNGNPPNMEKDCHDMQTFLE
jgi:hypothetical protein